MRKKEIPDFAGALPGTVGDLFARYRDSWETRSLDAMSAATRARYDQALRIGASVRVPKVMPGPVGSWMRADLEPWMADEIVRAIAKARSPNQANYSRTVMSSAFIFGMRRRLVNQNAFDTAERIPTNPPRARSWTDDEVKAVMLAAEQIGHPVVARALRLAQLTGQRPCDVTGLHGHNYDHARLTLTFRIRKTREEVIMPLPEAAPLFAGIAAGAPWLVDEDKGPITSPDKLRPLFRKAREAAGVREELWMADMRRTMLTQMHVAGATEDQILDVSRHRNRQQLQTYIQRTPRSRMGGLDKLREARGGSL